MDRCLKDKAHFIPVFETGEVVTGAAGTAAIVTVVLNGVDEGGNPKYLINFTIPRGADGTGGGSGTDRGRCIFTLEDYSAAYRPEAKGWTITSNV